ncbi:MAG: beta-propeller fold lactonase family protein [Gemmatimonadaceae bacterium]|nr:beta-propeller fold lactonase family protein [Gemmatimonadaceae bacterium]
MIQGIDFSFRRYSLALTTATLAALVLIGCDNSTTGTRTGTASKVLYLISNSATPGQNAVLGYTRAADGSLTAMAGSPFLTGGTGVANPTQGLGPDDVDFAVATSSDHKQLFAVNPGSNTIAVFDIAENGSLTSVAGSPFSSNGINPVSVAVDGNYLLVVNKAQDPAQPTTQLPNYATLAIAADGSLSPVPGAKVETVAGASPQMVLLSPSKSLFFGADFMAPIAPSPAGSLRSFTLASDGTFAPAPGTPLNIPGDSALAQLVLGLAVHPTQNILYVGFVTQNKLGVYNFDSGTGALTFRTSVANSGQAICWITTNATGSAIYTVDTGDNSMSWYDATAPLAPVEDQHLLLKNPGPSYMNAMGMPVPTSQAFQEALTPDGKFLYVVSQHTNPDFTAANGNVLHALAVAADGSLSEPGTPVALPVDTHTRPWGLVAF